MSEIDLEKLHKTLQRQIRKYLGGSLDGLPQQSRDFLKIVSDTYYHADDDRLLIERSLEISSRELTEINRNIEAKIRERTEELVNQRRTVETLLDNLPVGVFVIRAPSGEPTIINRMGIKILGRGIEAGIGSSNYAQVYQAIKDNGEPYPNDELPLNITLKEGRISQKEDVVIRRPDGDQAALRITAAPIFNIDGTFRTAVAVLEDVTKERQLERSRDEFFSIASHELRTPLTAIRGNTEMIQQYFSSQLDSPDLKEMIQDIHGASVRLIAIVNDFLDTSRLEQKRMKFEPTKFDINKLTIDVIRQYQVTGSRKGVLLNIQEGDEAIPLVYADEARTRQVLINLVSNALKFTEKGAVIISYDSMGEYVKVLVSDTGRGIPYDVQHRLFRKFEQAGSTVLTRDSVRGTGLGLYISKMIVEQMGGSIKLESSKPGAGSTFSFMLPVARTVPMNYNA